MYLPLFATVRSCAFPPQSLNVVAAVVLEVFEEDLSTAFAAFQRVVDVFLSGLLHKQALHKVRVFLRDFVIQPGPRRLMSCVVFALPAAFS